MTAQGVKKLWDDIKQEKVTVGFAVTLFIAAFWVDARYMTEAEADALGDRKHAPMIAEDHELAEKVEENTKLLQAHLGEFRHYRKAEAIAEVQALINNTNDKLFELQSFPKDARRDRQERELRNRLADYELRKDCLINDKEACD